MACLFALKVELSFSILSGKIRNSSQHTTLLPKLSSRRSAIELETKDHEGLPLFPAESAY